MSQDLNFAGPERDQRRGVIQDQVNLAGRVTLLPCESLFPEHAVFSFFSKNGSSCERGINFCLIFFSIYPSQHLQSSPDAQENIPPSREAIIINGKVNKGFNITQKKICQSSNHYRAELVSYFLVKEN